MLATDVPENEGIGENQFVIVGKDFNQDDLITETDTVIVQIGITGIFDDVRFALGSDRQPLVIDGAVNAGLNAGASWNFPAPRTAVGVKADGTVFFVVVDGRNKPAGMEGVTLPELAEIMYYFGAVDAFNLDGGGSSTMTLKDIEKLKEKTLDELYTFLVLNFGMPPKSFDFEYVVDDKYQVIKNLDNK